MNVWNFTGNLGRDAEQRYTANGDSIVSFTVAVKAGYGEKATTTWARCSLFGKRGDAVLPYLNKGQLVGISGELSEREWTDKDGLKRTALEVRVNDLTLLGSKDSSAQSTNPAPQRQQPRPQAKQSAATPADVDDDIPW